MVYNVVVPNERGDGKEKEQMSKKKYYLILDVETANSTEDALVYDLGFAVADFTPAAYRRHRL